MLVITLGIIKIHTYPGKVAAARKHPQTEAIEVTSLLGLLIFPLWMLALVWAYSGAVIGQLYVEEDAGGGDVPPAEAPSTIYPPEDATPAPASAPAATRAEAPTAEDASTLPAATTFKAPAPSADGPHGSPDRKPGADTEESD